MERATYTPVTHEDYYAHDFPLLIGSFPYYRGKPRMVQGKAHTSEEPYEAYENEPIPLSERSGIRQYVHMKPYVLEPQMFLTARLYAEPKQDGAIGEVLGSRTEGMRQHELGNAQAWYYESEKMIVLWECFFDSSFRTHPLASDPHMKPLWLAFEEWLVKQFPEAERFATPFNDPIAESPEEYQAFLHGLGYEPAGSYYFKDTE
jgi:hypothetical protein